MLDIDMTLVMQLGTCLGLLLYLVPEDWIE